MNGRPMYTDQPELPNRRAFFSRLAALAVAPFAFGAMQGCGGSKKPRITGAMVGGGSNTGHLVRSADAIPKPTSTREVDILIAGGGIAGLSAARWLAMNGVTNVALIEMDSVPGGNSTYGKNKVSAYPWAAHYLPLPSVENKELLDFLGTAGVIIGYKDLLPVYNEYHLCHDPEERLFINGHWQEGLIPDFGVPAADKQQITRFMEHVAILKNAKGKDGKYAFCIPVDNSSVDPEYRRLDSMTMQQYLEINGYTSTYLRWYLEYCCKDDYGTVLTNTSAWAGLHYFASRNGQANNADSTAVLAWPEGNGYLMNALKQQAATTINTNILAHRVTIEKDRVAVVCYDASRKTSHVISAQKLLLCTPQNVNKYLLGEGYGRTDIYSAAEYAPWVVANITVNFLPGKTKGMGLCWDNVIYGKQSVGYVNANHQNLNTPGAVVLTWYLPVVGDSPKAARKSIRNKLWQEWVDYIIADLSYAHPGIDQHISNIDVRVWGHGMVQPTVGYIWGNARRRAMQPIDNKVFFAHTDLSGMSIFEEGFYQGIRAAKQIIAAL